jgi:hypothetical protein
MNGYSVDGAGHIECSRDGVRFAHERVGIVRVDISRDTRDARALVDAVIGSIDEPRALTGRDRRGGAVLLFRVDRGVGINNVRLELALRDGTEITIAFGSEGQSVDPESYSWPKGRAPADVARDLLPPLYNDFAEIAHSAAWAAGARPADEWQRERAAEERIEQLKADVAAGRVKLNLTPEERAAEADAKLVEDNAGRELHGHDGIFAMLVLAARQRMERRKTEKAEAA